MSEQETPKNRDLRLPPRPVEPLRQALNLQKFPKPTENDAVGTPAGQQLATASEFTWEPFPTPMDSISNPAIALPACRSVRDHVKPCGPHPEELKMVVTAITQRNLRRRASWRLRNLDLGEEAQENQDGLLAGEGRVSEAKPDTYAGYLSRGIGLLARYKHELNIRAPTEDVDPRIFANWVLASKSTSTAGTWRNYRQAAVAVIRTIPSIHIEEAIGLLNEDLQVGADEGRSRTPLDGETDGCFAKRMDRLHFLRLRQAALDLKPSKVRFALWNWLNAGMHTGLRPMEWETAFIERIAHKDGSQMWLHVVALRGDEEEHAYRSLDITTFSSEAQQAVERMVELSRSWTSFNRFAIWQREVAKLLGSICDEIFPRMALPYTLWSLRYQFIANMASRYDREEVAALTNYVPSDKKAKHYQKRRPYWLKNEIEEVPAPLLEQVTRIRSRLQLADERQAIKSMKQAAARSRR
ncbi:hypothetical protein IVB40_11300 [Bradyrhizobium sp. 40]|jgi:hypothetical protein|uniref:hypothetical protein n=1 Tax=Bradyrhizobium sp. 40 TaxID=2782674 RepID=UPI001FFECB1D|nr:hypothetical protein [Bradyrhizobium sp. 40]UPJ44558.1 hypothetical protein IVB40_11300 [Bradyrhizobium sp. 40]